MDAMHDWFNKKGANLVRLTSSTNRAAAGNLYERLGYVQDGQVWRADLRLGNSMLEAVLNERAARTIVASATKPSLGDKVIFSARATDYRKPMGHKAWVQDVSSLGGVDGYADALANAHAMLLKQGAPSANMITWADTDPKLITAMGQLGYAKRDTRVYTLELANVVQ